MYKNSITKKINDQTFNDGHSGFNIQPQVLLSLAFNGLLLTIGWRKLIQQQNGPDEQSTDGREQMTPIWLRVHGRVTNIPKNGLRFGRR
jgi:hypothetical protein